MKRRIHLFLVGIVALSAASAFAQSTFPEEGFYAYALAGTATTHTNAAFSGDQRNRWTIGGGYDFNKYLGFETGYMDGSHIKMVVDTAAGPGTGRIEEKLNGWTYAIVGKLPINDSFKLRGSIGQQRMDTLWSTSGGSLPTDNEPVKMNFTVWTFGGELYLDRRTSLRLEYWRTLNKSDPQGEVSHFDGILGGINVRF